MQGFQTRGIGPVNSKPQRGSRMPPRDGLRSYMAGWDDSMITVRSRRRAATGQSKAQSRRRKSTTVVERGIDSAQYREARMAELAIVEERRDTFAAAGLVEQARNEAHKVRSMRADLGIGRKPVEVALAESSAGALATAMGRDE